MVSYSIDELVEKYNFKVPNYIKLDVDNIEDKIIYGAEKTLSNKKVKGLLVELNETEKVTEVLIDFLKQKGLELKEKRHSDMFDNSVYRNFYNHIFVRK